MSINWKKWKGLIVGTALAAIAFTANRANALTNPATLYIDVTVSASASVTINAAQTSTASPTIAWSDTTRVVAAGDNSGYLGSSATVINSGNLTERWYLSTNAQSLDQTGANPWTLVVSSNIGDVGLDQFALQAVFASSNTAASGGANGCPQSGSTGNTNANDAMWNSTTTIVSAAGPTVGVTGNAYGAQGAIGTAYTNYVNTQSQTVGGASAYPDTGTGYQMYSNSLGNGYGLRALCWRVILPVGVNSADTQVIPLIVTASQN
jgi:hypothetical protein